MLQKCLK